MTKRTKQILAGIAGLVLILIIIGLKKTPKNEVVYRLGDNPPEISFTWSPEQPADLLEMSAKVRITDDHGIDFLSYRFTIVDIDRTLDFPVEGLIGTDWEQPISLSLIANDARLVGRESITIRISVTDDMGHSSQIEKVITFKKK